MILRILLKLNGELRLPIAHHDVLRKVFYGLVEREKVEEWHRDTRSPRPYTFSRILGKSTIEGKEIVFHEGISWWISSLDSELLGGAVRHLMTCETVSFGTCPMTLSGVDFEPSPAFPSSIRIETLSPIVADDNVSGKIVSYDPYEESFATHIQSNACRKARHFLGDSIDCSLSILPIQVDKVVTWFKTTPVVGYRGQFQLTSHPSVIRLLYDTGIGRRNGLGFGCFRWLV